LGGVVGGGGEFCLLVGCILFVRASSLHLSASKSKLNWKGKGFASLREARTGVYFFVVPAIVPRRGGKSIKRLNQAALVT